MPNKSLGQHWLHDRLILEAIVNCALPVNTLYKGDSFIHSSQPVLHEGQSFMQEKGTVVEIGPGLGMMTSVLLARAGRVIAVEFDADLARKLPGQFPGKNLTVVHQDILSYDFSGLPDDFIVVGNIPYYITNKIVRKVSEVPHRPKTCVLLVQKEVAERLAAGPGELSILAISAQVYFEVSLGPVVGAEYFTPPPKVDSQVVVMHRREQPLITDDQTKVFFRVVKAGFSARRKKLRSSLAGGLGISKTDAEKLLAAADISPDARAQELSFQHWLRMTICLWKLSRL